MHAPLSLSIIPIPAISNAQQQIASVVFPDAQVLITCSFYKSFQLLFLRPHPMIARGPLSAQSSSLAQVKIFLNASSSVRAERRHAELTAAGTIMSYEQVLHDIESRDAADYSRPVGALKKVGLLSPSASLVPFACTPRRVT
jgi:hypothetical protein